MCNALSSQRDSPKNEVYPFVQMLGDPLRLQGLPLDADELIRAAPSPRGQLHISQPLPILQRSKQNRDFLLLKGTSCSRH